MDESEKVPEGTDPSAPHSDANEEQTLDIDKQNKLNLLDNQIESLENIENFLQAQTHNNDNEDAAFDRLQNDTTDGTSQIKKLNDVGRRDSFDNDKSDAYSETDDTSINKQNSDSVRRRSGSTEVESSISEAIAHNQHDGGENERDESEHGENELDKSELGENDRENSEDGENELAEDEDKVESSNDSTVKSKRKEQPMDTSDIPENDADLQKNDNEMETEEADDAEADHDHEENEKENASVTEADNDEDRPEFEDAPDHNADDSEHEEQSQETEDPFDELLKDKSSKDTSKAAEDESKEESAKNSAAEDDDNLDTTEERSQDDSLHEDGELEEVIGEESEECLLPDKDEQLIGEVSSHQPETKDASTENCEAGDSEAEKANEEEKETEDAEEEEKETGDVEEDEKETGDVEEEVKETGDVEEEEKETGDVEEEEKETGDVEEEEKETGDVEKEEKETGDAEEEDEKETGDAEEEEKETEDAEEEGNTAAEASEVLAIRKRKFPEKKGAAASKDADESLADEEETVGGETTVDETNTENDKEAEGSVAGADESVADDDEEEEAPAEEEEGGGGGRPAGGGRQGLVREVLESVPRLCARCGAKRPAPFLYYDEGKRWLCSAACLAALRTERPGAFRLERRKMIVCETEPVDAACARCLERKACAFAEKTKVRFVYYCSPECLRDEREGEGGREATMLARAELRDIPLREQTCRVCRERKTCRYETVADVPEYVCDDGCKPTAAGSEPRRPRGRPRKLKAAEESPPRRRSPKARAPLPAKAAPAKATPAKAAPAKATPAKATPAKLPPGRPPSAKGTPAKAQPTPAKAHSSKKRAAAAQEASPRASGPPLLKLKVMGNATDKYLERGAKVSAKSAAQAASAREERERSFVRACAKCGRPVDGDERNLSWETMDFCDESCLGDYQTATGSRCANCRTAVTPASLGKYCVRFGYDVRQFCRSRCLEEFKKGLKICCYCQRDITGDCEGFLAPVGDKGQFKDFCSQPCMEKFDRMSKNPAPAAVWAHCAVCSHRKLAPLEVQVDGGSQRLCSEPCFAAFKFVNNVFPDQCRWCKKYFERKAADAYTIYADNAAHCFCTKACFNVYISNSRHIVPCNWCKVKKYNFDMIKKTLASGQSLTMCSLNCLTLYRVSINAVSSRRVKCDKCERVSQAQYHLTMSDATVRNFCTYQCVMSFQGQYGKPGAAPPAAAGQPPPAVPTGAPRRTALQRPLAAKSQIQNATTPQRGAPAPVRGAATPARGAALPSRGSTPRGLPVIAAAESPAGGAGHATRAKSKAAAAERPASPEPPPPPPPRAPTPPPPPPKIYSHVLVKPPPPAAARNAATMARPLVQNRAVSCRPQTASKECQTGPELERRVLVPVPVPVYVPVPLAMFSLPFPVPVPLPLPVPVPVFVPTTRNSADGIMKEIKKIHDKMPTDPFEAELLMMAEMVAGEKKKADSDSETDDDNEEGFSPAEGAPGLEAVQNAAFGEDMLQMALKMATEYEEPPVDLESAMQASTITPAQSQDESHGHHHQQAVQAAGEQQRAAAALAVRAAAAGAVAAAPGGRKRGAPAARAPGGKRRRDAPAGAAAPAPPEPPAPPQEKPDANMCLKYTFGVNAWKQWVMTKNAEMEKSSIRRKPFKSEILQLTADELNYSLCLFVKEVRKPNGSEYAPDTIYYLVLGIQQYLFENGRIDNIFTDPYYEKFTECLDEVARKFSVLYNDSQYIVTRVEEEHLWESKQLGAHSPHVLLSTLMFFNTKHFNLVTVEEHMQLSFSHIMKHWKRNPNSPGAAKMPGSRNVLLRFYPPQAALEANSRKKKVYEQQENEENPLRCPVKLYEFYLSKCPESVKTRNDVFYLLPERSCVPDSPVWYSTQALAKDALAKMLHRVKMVKEINIALLTS